MRNLIVRMAFVAVAMPSVAAQPSRPDMPVQSVTALQLRQVTRGGGAVASMLPWGWGVKCDCRLCADNGSTLTGCSIQNGQRTCKYENGAIYQDPCN